MGKCQSHINEKDTAKNGVDAIEYKKSLRTNIFFDDKRTSLTILDGKHVII